MGKARVDLQVNTATPSTGIWCGEGCEMVHVSKHFCLAGRRKGNTENVTTRIGSFHKKYFFGYLGCSCMLLCIGNCKVLYVVLLGQSFFLLQVSSSPDTK